MRAINGVSLIAVAAAVLPRSFQSEVAETVLLGGVRVSKDAYEADKEGLEKLYGKPDAAKAQDANAAEPAVTTGTPVEKALDAPLPPAPSAPNFGNPVPPSIPSPDTYQVAKVGTGKSAKFFAVSSVTGDKLTGFVDIDEDGYATEAEAWAAIMKVKMQPHLQQIDPPANVPEAPKLPDNA